MKEKLKRSDEDCFGRFHDPDVAECRRCSEEVNCGKVVEARAAQLEAAPELPKHRPIRRYPRD